MYLKTFFCIFILIFQINLIKSKKIKNLRFVKQPESVMGTLNQTVSLDCIPKPLESKIEWLLNEEPIKIDKKIISTGKSLFIQLPSTIYENVGRYSFEEFSNAKIQCKAKYKNFVLLSNPVEVIIATLKDFPYSEIDELKVDVKEQNIAVIPCNPPSSRSTVVTEFIFKDSLISANNKKYEIMPSGNLQIFNVSTKDSGRYQCVAMNPFSKERKNSSLIVTLHVERKFDTDFNINDRSSIEKLDFLVKPKSNYNQILGTNLVLECVANSILPVKVSWFRNDDLPLPENRHTIKGGNLFITEIRQEDKGFYYCKAFNGYKSINSTSRIEVNEVPKIKRKLSSVQLQPGNNTFFECSVVGNPTPEIDWFFNGNKISSLNQDLYQMKIEKNLDSSRLYINNISLSHSGFVQCFAFNNLQTTNSAAKIIVSNKVVLLPKKDKKNQKTEKKNLQKVLRPTILKIIRLNSKSVLLYWNVPNYSEENSQLKLNFFKIQYKPSENCSSDFKEFLTLDEDIPPYINSFSITDLKIDCLYNFTVVAAFLNENDVRSPSKNYFLTLNHSGNRPLGYFPSFQSKPDSSSSIKISWDYTESFNDKTEGFIIHYRLAERAESYNKITIDDKEARNYLITNLLPQKLYDVCIQSYNSAGVSDFSKIEKTKTLLSTDDSSNELSNTDEDEISKNEIETSKENFFEKENNNVTNEINHNDITNTFDLTVPVIQNSFAKNFLLNLKATYSSFKVTDYSIISIFSIFFLIVVVSFCCFLTTIFFKKKNKTNKKSKHDSKFNLDDDEALTFALNQNDNNSLSGSFTKMNVFKEPIYSNQTILSTNPHLTRKYSKNYNQNYATISGKNLYKNNSVQDSTLINFHVNKFSEDSASGSLLNINRNYKRDSNKISNTLSNYNLNKSNIHNKNLLLPNLPETSLKKVVNTLDRRNGTRNKNFEEIYGTNPHFATINRTNSFARLNGTLERKRKSRNDLFNVLNIKEEYEPVNPIYDTNKIKSFNMRNQNYNQPNSINQINSNTSNNMNPNTSKFGNDRVMMSMMQSSC